MQPRRRAARETGGGGREDTETNQGFRWLSLLESLHPFLALSHPYGRFLACSHQLSDHQGHHPRRASEASSEAAERVARGGGDGGGGVVGVVTETPPF